MLYRLPSSTSEVSCSWACHRDRNPPSSEPGTDYATPYGSTVYAVADGTVTWTQTHPGNATGRFCEYRLTDGRTTRTLHMSRVDVAPGRKVLKGQPLGLSGASGMGQDWYYGPHIHQTLWPGEAWATPTIDFQLYVGEEPPPEPPRDEDDMPKNSGFHYIRTSDSRKVHYIINPGSGFFLEWSDPSLDVNAIAAQFDTGPFAEVTQGMRDTMVASLGSLQELELEPSGNLTGVAWGTLAGVAVLVALGVAQLVLALG